MMCFQKQHSFTPLENAQRLAAGGILPQRARGLMPHASSLAGLTLLFALLVVSAALSVSLGVANIVLGELLLSSTGRDSQVAFYTADSGVECALYWDLTGDRLLVDPDVSCAGSTVPLIRNQDGTEIRFRFEIETVFGASCADVKIEKDDQTTTVTALGNFPSNPIPDGGCSVGLRTVQRGLEASFRR